MNYKRLLAIGGVATAGIIGMTSTAHAALIEVDHPRINNSHVDYGGEARAFGGPVLGARLEWDVTNGVVTADLDGYVHWADRSSGGCGRVTVTYFDSDNHVIGNRTSPAACRIGSGPPEVRHAPIVFSAQTLDHLKIQAQEADNATSQFQDEGLPAFRGLGDGSG
jgi:hypothetical protein